MIEPLERMPLEFPGSIKKINIIPQNKIEIKKVIRDFSNNNKNENKNTKNSVSRNKKIAMSPINRSRYDGDRSDNEIKGSARTFSRELR